MSKVAKESLICPTCKGEKQSPVYRDKRGNRISKYDEGARLDHTMTDKCDDCDGTGFLRKR